MQGWFDTAYPSGWWGDSQARSWVPIKNIKTVAVMPAWQIPGNDGADGWSVWLHDGVTSFPISEHPTVELAQVAAEAAMAAINAATT